MTSWAGRRFGGGPIRSRAINCACEYSDEDKSGPRLTTCAGHAALVNDQRFLDGLLWIRHNRDIYKAKEWGAM
jgi:hypothetical protein